MSAAQKPFLYIVKVEVSILTRSSLKGNDMTFEKPVCW